MSVYIQPCIAAGPRDLDRGLEIKCHVRIRGSEIAAEPCCCESTTPASTWCRPQREIGLVVLDAGS